MIEIPFFENKDVFLHKDTIERIYKIIKCQDDGK